MSRCYPFPPPGYLLKETRNDSLIKSVKGDKEIVKREKKDRKHKRKEKVIDADRSRKHRVKRRRKDEIAAIASKKADDHGEDLINSEVEFLEKSCLTVELEQQTTSQTSCDSTLRTNEVQSPSHPLGGRHDDSETGMSKGPKNPEVKDQKQCSSANTPKESIGHSYSTSANEATRDALRFSQRKRRDSKHSKEKKTVHLNEKTKACKEKKPLSSLRTQQEQDKPSSSNQETIGTSKSVLCRKCPSSVVVNFLNLIENWTHDRIESKISDSEDQKWWLVTKFGDKRHHQVSSNEKISQGSSSSMMWPTARFLPEADIHALPFTLPF